METIENRGGIAFICDRDGTILQVIGNDLHLEEEGLVGSSVIGLAVPTNVVKMLSFLAELKVQNALFNWEINTQIHGQMLPLYFTGVHHGRDLLIVASGRSENLDSLYSEMVQIQNEQIALFRDAKKSEFELRSARQQDHQHYDELSALNDELVNLQRELTLKNEELERLNAEKDRFLGMAAHDLRNPLMVILSYSDFLLDEDSTLRPTEAEMVAAIRDSSQFMHALVTDLLDIATIEAGELRLDKQPTDLQRLFSRIITLNNVLAAAKRIKISLSGGEALPVLRIDRQKMIQVMNNLLSNAVKFSPMEANINVNLTQQGQEVLVAVQDSGPGIPAAEMDKLFKPFSITSVKSSAGEKNTGLGLTISRRIIEGHGGRIWAESEWGQGATFFFILPIPQP